jgi:TP901 family phage tail tape measure protein
MAQAFNLTAQLQLQAPGNVNQVVNQIRRQLKPMGVKINIQNAKNLAQANSNLSSFNKNAQNSTKSVNQLNRTLQESARRFSVITIATGSFLALANSFKKSVKEAVAFETELLKISQVTGKSVAQLGSLANEVTRLGTSLGASSSDLLNVARTLTQAGFAADETRKALDILAKTSLAATFDNIRDTTEGAIAILRQFGDQARQSGGDIAFLEQSLDAINAVSKRFAVESADLITAIRRTGGVFASAGGEINELIALFTAVRSTTRESAETIATGLRTIFTRIQRPESINQLREFGIELQDAQGNFVGAFEAFKRLSIGLQGIDPKTTAFSQIVEDLGGFRQVGKVIPLIQQFTTAQQALSVAQGASGSVARDALVAQQGLGNQIQKVREQFDALIRKFVDSSAFRSLAEGGIKLAEAFIKIAESLEPLLPMLLTLVGLKLGRGLAPMLAGVAGFGRGGGGGGGRPISRFASGGMVPGSGNRDTVPAMLTPGEFVIKKSSVNKLGAGTLAAMNQNKFNEGTRIRESMGRPRAASTRVIGDKYGTTQVLGKIDRLDEETKAALNADLGTYGGAFLRPEARDQVVQGQVNVSEIQEGIRKNPKFAALKALAAKSKTKGLAAQVNKKLEDEIKNISAAASGSQAGFVLRAGSLESASAEQLEDTILGGITNTVRESTRVIGGKLGTNVGDIAKILKTANIDNVVGNIFEATLLSAGVPFGNEDRDSSADFDFPSGLGQRAGLFGLQGIANEQTDAKSSFTNANIKSFIKKVKNVETKKSIKDIDSRLVDDFEAIKSALNTAIMQEGGMSLFGAGIKGQKEDQKARREALVKGRAGILNRNSGGSVPGSDTVPAMLTPGEFVMSKSASQSIGYTNLNRMNKQGVQGYADGGIVGFQSYATGTGTLGATSAGAVSFKGIDSGDIKGAVERLSQSLAKMGVSFDKQIPVLLKFEEELKKGGKVSEALAKTFKNTDVNVKRTSDQIKKTNQERQKEQQAIKKSAASRIQSAAGKVQGVAGGVGQVAGTLQSMVFLGSAIAAVTSQFGDLEDSTKTAITQTATLVTTVVAVGAMLVSTVAELAVQAAAGAAALAAKVTATMASAGTEVVEAGANTLSSGTEAVEAGTNTLSAGTELAEASTNTLSAGTEVAEAGANAVVIATEIGESAANVGATVSEVAETAANTASAGAAGLVTVALLALAAVVVAILAIMTVVAVRFTYLGFKAKAVADEMGEAAEELKQKFAETGEGIEEIISKLNSQAEQETIAGNNFESAAAVFLGGIGARMTGASEREVAGADLGGMVGALIGFFTPLGPVLGYLIGSSIGLAAAQEAQAKIEKKINDDLSAVLYNRLKAEQDLIQGLNQFKKTLSDIDSLEISAEEKTERRIKAVDDLGDKGTAGRGAELQATSERARETAIAAATFRNANNAEAASKIRGLTDEELRGILAKDGGAASLGLNPLEAEQLNSALRAITTNLDIAANRVAESRKTLGDAASQADPSKSFQELISENGSYAQALRQNIQAINHESKIREANLLREADRLDEAAKNAESEEEKKSYKDRAATLRNAAEEEAQIRKDTAQDIWDTQEQARNATKDRYDEEQRIIAANIELRRSLLEAAEAVAVFADRTRELENIGNNLDDIASIRGGGGTELRAQTLTETEFSSASDLQRYANEADAIIASLANSSAKRQAEIAKNAALNAGEFIKAATDPQKGLLGASGLDINATDDLLKQQLLKDFNIDLSGLSDELQKLIIKSIRDAGGTIDASELDDIISNASESAAENNKILEEISAGNQAYLDAYSKYLSEVKAQYDAELAFRQKAYEAQEGIIDSELEARNLLAKSRDREANEIGPDRAAREARRRAKAQSDLDAAGVGVTAGDIGGLSTARDAVEKDLLEMDKEIKRFNESGSLKEAAAAATEQEKLQQKLSAINSELDRVGDQSAARQDIINEMQRNIDTVQKEIEAREELIEVEKRAREQMYSVLEEFVVGGQEDRQRLAQGARGAQFAVQTGTLQNQSEEQRRNTVAFLDKLSDVEITFDRQTGEALTGREVKERLVFNDAIQMGFPPEIARQIATATSKEQQLIDEVKQLNNDLVATNTDLYNQLVKLNEHIDKAVQAQEPSDNFLNAATEQMKAAEKQLEAAQIFAGAVGSSTQAGPPGQPGEEGYGTVLRPYTGGHIGSSGALYRANGGSIFKPKGTDTVPAMLTPGEFVIRKSAVDKVGVGALQAINDGAGVVPGFAKGGVVYAYQGLMVPRNRNDYNKKPESLRYSDSFLDNMPGGDSVRSFRNSTLKSLDLPVGESQTFNRVNSFSDDELFKLRKKSRLTDKTIESGAFKPAESIVGVLDRQAAEKKTEDDKKRFEEQQRKYTGKLTPDSPIFDPQNKYNDALKFGEKGQGFGTGGLPNGLDAATFEAEAKGELTTAERIRLSPSWSLDEGTFKGASTSSEADRAAFEAGLSKIQEEEKNRVSTEEANAAFERSMKSSKDFNDALTARQKADGSYYSAKADKMNAGFGTMGGGDIEDSFTILQRQKEKADALANAQKALDQTIPGSVAYNKAKRDLEELQDPNLAARNFKADQKSRQDAKMSFGGSKAAKARRDAANAGFVGPLRPGETGADQGRDNASTRRKERLATQREKLSGGKSTKDMSPEEVIQELRKARGMRMRGRSKDGQKFGSSTGSRFVDSLASYRGGRQMGGYGGGYGNQMVPFGFIPGSPYNSMLGRGGYNIPMFDKRMLFGNGAAFFANGGAAAGGDTVPAMLTPGEFVMNKGAVDKYGVGFMRNLNKGKVQGFNKGGIVQYKSDGDILRPNTGQFTSLSMNGGAGSSIDDAAGKLKGVFGGFVDNISSTFDNLVSPLNGVVQSLNQIAQSFGNFTMQHTVNVEGLINVGGLNVETLKNELSSSIGEMVASEVAKVMDNQNKTFKSN